jgi:hypothetical protein
VSNESYDLTAGEGRRIWEQCLEHAHIAATASSHLPQVAGPASAVRHAAVCRASPRTGDLPRQCHRCLWTVVLRDRRALVASPRGSTYPIVREGRATRGTQWATLTR